MTRKNSTPDLDSIRESTLLKTLLESPDNTELVYTIADSLKYNHFKVNKYAYMYKAIIETAIHRGNIDYISIAEEIKKAKLGEVCKPQDVLDIQNTGYAILNAEGVQSYADEIRTTFQVYQGKGISDSIRDANTLSDLVKSHNELGNILDASSSKPFSDTEERSLKVLEEIGEAREKGGARLHLMFHQLDDRMGGMWPGEVMVIGASTGVGKSTLAYNIAWKISPLSRPGIISAEMDEKVTYLKLYSVASGVPVLEMRKGLNDEQMAKVSKAAIEVAKRGITFDFHSLDIDTLKVRARRMYHQKGIKLLIIDYLQLIKCDKGNNREQEVANCIHEIKWLARDLGIPIIVLSQVNRAYHARKEQRPHLHDLRESGAVEQAIDFGLLMWRTPDESLAHFDLAKGRPGAKCGEFDLPFDWDRGCYRDV